MRAWIGVLFLGLAATAAEAGSIVGTVKTRAGKTAGEAEVTLVELKRKVKADASGAYRFDDVPDGVYLLDVLSPRYGTAVGQVVVSGGEARGDLVIDLGVHHEDVVVTANISPQGIADLAQSVAVLDDRELTTKAAPTLGETLERELGVSATAYAPGTSRPIIRGLSGDRVRILQDGLGVGDASNVSPDHAVTLDPYAAERIEVVRGAATLLYGSNAIGGVVNVLDERIPDHRTDEALKGSVHLRYAGNAGAATGAASLGGTARSFGWHADFAKTDAGEYSGGGDFGEKPNSDLESQSASIGASWLGDTAFAGAAYNRFETEYGSAVEDEVRIDMTQKRWDLRGGINVPFGPFRFLKARVGGTDYRHVEMEGGAVGTTFLNSSFEGRVEMAHEQAGAWIGSFGVQAFSREMEAIGDEAFIAPADDAGIAAFAFEEVGTGSLRGQFGARLEHQALDSSVPSLPDRDFTAPSASAGLLWKSGEEYVATATLSYSSRVPTTEELYANGPHVATFSFEVGDPALDLERGLGIDAAFRKLSGRVQGELSLFGTQFSDYIYERDTGNTVEIEPGEFLPVIQYAASEARIWGGEAHLDVSLMHAEPHHLDLEMRVDYVHAELTELDEPVPLQPPLRGALGLKYQGRALWASVEGFHARKQDRFGASDVATPGYTWLNAAVGYRLVAGRLVHDVVLRGTNLLDDLSFASTSRFRFEVPLPGRDVTAAYRLQF